jgi:cell division protein FtsI (penicillin-binding protein 3)
VDQRLSGGETFDRYNEELGEREFDIPVDKGFQELSAVLGIDAETLKSSILGDKSFNYVARTVTPDVKNRALAVGLPGVYADATSVRTYPAGPVAGSIIGYVGPDGVAREGLELSLMDELTEPPAARPMKSV